MLRLLTHVLVMLLAMASFMQPFHSIPWPSALNEGAALVLGLFVSSVTLLRNISAKIEVTKFELVLLLLLIVHGTILSTSEFQRSMLPVMLIAGIVFCCLKMPAPNNGIIHSLFASIFVAGVASCLLGIGLWLGIFQEYENYQVWMSHANPGSPLSGNLSQPNQVGTLILWAIVVSLYYFELINKSESTKDVKWALGGGVVFAILLMAIGIALTQSRTALLNMGLLTLIVLIFRAHFNFRTRALISIALLVVVVISAGLPYLKSAILGIDNTAVMGGKTFADRPRLIAYSVFLNAIWSEWALGYGIGGVVFANIANMLPGNPLNMYFGHAHNIFIDIFVWFGMPLGLFVSAFIIGRLWRLVMQVKTTEEMAILGMFSVVLVHALLEYPLHYAYFLVPCAICYRFCKVPSSSSGYLISTRWIFTCWILSLIVFYVVAKNYLEVEQDIRQAKLQMAIMGAPVSAPPDYENKIVELKHLNVAMRADVKKPLSPHERAAYDYIVGVYPTKSFLNNYIDLLVQDGDLAGAQLWTFRRDSLYTK
ncbi:Virulence factor membrane-bound polymerase, C-terminal [Comamonadaceae bacterium]